MRESVHLDAAHLDAALLDAALLDAAMSRALDLARRGPVTTSNPQVGCVFLDASGRIVAEGWHRGSGTPHAEIDALAHLPREWHGRESELTAVVTLEPCNHRGKTGPCAAELAARKVAAVVWALDDPNPRAAGGSTTLTAAGIPTKRGVRAPEARSMLSWWLASQPTPHAEGGALERPHVTLKWAQSLDGRAAANDGSSQWITGPEARADVHRRRAEADAIAIGTGTLLADDPALTARDARGDLLVPAATQPVPVVFGDREIPAHARINAHPALAARGLDGPLRYAPASVDASGQTPQFLRESLSDLHSMGYQYLFVEGGPRLQSALLEAGVVDRVIVYVAPVLLGGAGLAIAEAGVATLADRWNLGEMRTTQFGPDVCFDARVIERKEPEHVHRAR